VAERLQRIGVWSVLSLGLILRIWTLDQKSPWLDEASSWHFATSRLPDLMWSTSTDVHPPLYFLLLKAWIVVFGDSLTALRGLSVVGGMAALYLIYRLAALFVTRWVALAVLAWCAVSPLTIYYSQEARMYALAMACALGACYGYVRWVDSDYTSRAALAGYAVAAILALYLHYFTSLVIGAIWMHAILARVRRRRRPPWWGWVWVHAAMALLYLPWVSTAMAQIARGQAWWRGTVDPVNEVPSYALTLLHELGVSTMGVQLVGTYTGPVVVLLLVVGLAGLAGAAVRDSRDRLLAMVTLVPPAVGIALLLTGGHMELSRYLSYAAPLMILGAARGLAALEVRPPVAAAVMLVGACAVLPSLGRYYETATKDSDVRPIVAYLNQVRQGHARAPGPILVMPGYVENLAQYVSERGLATRRIDTDADFSRAIVRTGRSWPAVWLIVDYRWPGFAALAADRRFREEPIAATTPDRIKLYRLN
jgi:4-amino-4-deoxy-L-arabinose transferase-like glycosyltransferase